MLRGRCVGVQHAQASLTIEAHPYIRTNTDLLSRLRADRFGDGARYGALDLCRSSHGLPKTLLFGSADCFGYESLRIGGLPAFSRNDEVEPTQRQVMLLRSNLYVRLRQLFAGRVRFISLPSHAPIHVHGCARGYIVHFAGRENSASCFQDFNRSSSSPTSEKVLAEPSVFTSSTICSTMPRRMLSREPKQSTSDHRIARASLMRRPCLRRLDGTA